MMGWLIYESIVRHPAVLTSAEITRRLGVNEKTALLMKRRLQLMAHDMRPAFQSLIREELAEAFPHPYKLPPDGEDVRPAVAGKPVVHADTMALFSASLRANKGRKRHKHKGLTASIYLSDKLGGRQVGTLAHVMGTEKGWVQIDSISDLTANTVGPIIRKAIPRNAAIFTDEGYQWLYRVYPNHRMVNHSKKSKDKRYKMARDRWCQNGVHNQVSEGINGSLKIAMRGYRYFRPEHSNHYLMEWEFLRNLKYFGLDKVAEHIQRSDLPRRGIFDCADNGGGISGAHSIRNTYQSRNFMAEPSRNRSSHLLNGKIDTRLKRLINKGLFQNLHEAMIESDAFWKESASPSRKRKERIYQSLAQRMYDQCFEKEYIYLSDFSFQTKERKQAYRVLRRWQEAGIAELRDLTPGIKRKSRLEYGFRLLIPRLFSLPRILYSQSIEEYQQTKKGADQ